MPRHTIAAALALAVALALAGCRKVPPPVTEAEGTVLLDGKPLPQAQVEFVPQLSNFGAEVNSTAVTDDQGHFQLTCAYNQRSGAVVGKHHVLVSDPPPSADMRGMDERSQTRLAQYQAKLKNRPIPDVYRTLGKTPLVVEVKPGEKTYDLQLKRDTH
jgi:hypothetical protein